MGYYCGQVNCCFGMMLRMLAGYPLLLLSLRSIPHMLTLPWDLSIRHPSSDSLKMLEISRAVWHKHSDRGIPPLITQKFLNGFEHTTQHSYSTTTKLWYLFCVPRKIDLPRPSLTDLTEHFADESAHDAVASKVVLRWILHE